MTLEELEKRVKVLEDIEAIKKLHINYVYLLCNLQWDDMVECFAEDATMELLDQGVCKGKKEISGVFHNVLAKMIKRNDGHFVGQPIISVEGDKAKGHWILYLFFAEPEVRWLQGRQDCEYVRVKGEWKFSSVKFTAPWPGA
ncbi:MAG: nuclear transport factor 2 family protein [Dehalococcoidia bacterium]|nr:MAG: nuclear transport factor 2 family protein [Dehalococcoidia bacterium]